MKAGRVFFHPNGQYCLFFVWHGDTVSSIDVSKLQDPLLYPEPGVSHVHTHVHMSFLHVLWFTPTCQKNNNSRM